MCERTLHASSELSLRKSPLSKAPRTASTPRRRGPAGSTDCHFYIFGPHDRYPLSPARGFTLSPDAKFDTYRNMAETLGNRTHGDRKSHPICTDHQCAIDSLEVFGRKRAKGVAVVNESFTRAALEDSRAEASSR